MYPPYISQCVVSKVLSEHWCCYDTPLCKGGMTRIIYTMTVQGIFFQGWWKHVVCYRCNPFIQICNWTVYDPIWSWHSLAHTDEICLYTVQWWKSDHYLKHVPGTQLNTGNSQLLNQVLNSLHAVPLPMCTCICPNADTFEQSFHPFFISNN
jgi:hypothetical protein